MMIPYLIPVILVVALIYNSIKILFRRSPWRCRRRT